MKTYHAEMNRSQDAVKLAALDNRTLEPHEGYNRGNDGAWVIPIKDEEGETVARIEVFFRGNAKKSQAFTAPDPEGQQIARAIVERMNS
jgi:hypothetical protein